MKAKAFFSSADHSKGYAYRVLNDFVVHIAGANPSQASLCGSNVFLVGHQYTSERIMIDAGDITSRNGDFINNLKNYLTNQ